MRYRVFVNSWRLRNRPTLPFLQVYDTTTGDITATFEVAFPHGSVLTSDLEGFHIDNVDHPDHPHLPKRAKFVCWVEADHVEYEHGEAR